MAALYCSCIICPEEIVHMEKDHPHEGFINSSHLVTENTFMKIIQSN